MAKALRVDGVQLIVEGLNRFIGDLNAAGLAWKKLATEFQLGSRTVQQLSKTLSALPTGTQAIGGLTTQVDNLSQSVGGLSKETEQNNKGIKEMIVGFVKAHPVLSGTIAILGGVAAALGAATKKAFDLAKQAAPLEGLEAQFAAINQEVVGGSGAMLSALQKGSAGMIANRDLMRSFNDAAALVNKNFAQRLPEALELVGKVSLATGESTSFLLDSLVRGIGRVSPMIIDNLKIQVSTAEATRRATEMFGKQKDQLSKVEQQMALTDITLERLEEKFGALPGISKTTSAQLAQVQTNLQNIADTIGQAFGPALNDILQVTNQWLTAIAASLQEGGRLNKILNLVAGTFSMVTEFIKRASNAIFVWLTGATGMSEELEYQLNQSTTSVLDWADNLATTMLNLASDAIEWGVNIAASFAEGIITGASDALIVAMEFIGDMLSSWLSPGSPPKVAPALDRWGVDAMGEFLHGMTEADFGILDTIQGSLGKLLSKMDLGRASGALIEAISGGDREGVFAIIEEQAGQFAPEIQRMVELQWELADSTAAVAEQEKTLAQGREQLANQQNKVAEETLKYNEMLRQGADPKLLNAQLAQINAAEDALSITQEQVATSDDDLKNKKDRLAELKQEAALQGKVVDELLSLNTALTEEEEKEKKVRAGRKKGAAAPEVQKPEIPGIGKIDIGGKIGAAVDATKEMLKEKFGGLFQPLKDAWDNITLSLGGVGSAWQSTIDTIGNAWIQLKKDFPFLQDIETWVKNMLAPEGLPALITEWGTYFLEGIKNFYEFAKDPLLPFFTEILGLFADVGWAAFTTWWDGLLTSIQTLWTWGEENLIPWFEEKLPGVISVFQRDTLNPLTTGFTSIRDAIKSATEWLSSLRDKVQGFDASNMWPFIGKSPAPLAVGINSITDSLQRLERTNLTTMGGMTSQFQPVNMTRAQMTMGQGNTSQPIHIEFSGPMNISNGMDMKRVETAITRTVQKAIQRSS